MQYLGQKKKGLHYHYRCSLYCERGFHLYLYSASTLIGTCVALFIHAIANHPIMWQQHNYADQEPQVKFTSNIRMGKIGILVCLTMALLLVSGSVLWVFQELPISWDFHTKGSSVCTLWCKREKKKKSSSHELQFCEFSLKLDSKVFF